MVQCEVVALGLHMEPLQGAVAVAGVGRTEGRFRGRIREPEGEREEMRGEDGRRETRGET